MHGITDQNGARFRYPLHPRGDIGSLAKNVSFLASARTNYDWTRIDADSCRKFRAPRLTAEVGDSIEHRQARSRRTLRIIVVRLRIAKEGHHAIAEVLGDVAAKSSDYLGGGAMIIRNCLTPFFRVQPPSDLGRADEIAKQYCQVAAFAH